MRTTSRIDSLHPVIIALLLLATFIPAATASAQSWTDSTPFSPDAYGNGVLQFGFLTTTYQSAEDADQDGTLGGTFGFGFRYADGLSYQPGFDLGRFSASGEDTTVLRIRPLDVVVEFIRASSSNGSVRFSVYSEFQTGIEFQFFTEPGLFGDRDQTSFYLPFEGAIGMRLYIDRLFLFGTFTGGFDLAIDTTSATRADNLWRFGANAGVGFLF
ncbi:MAG: hypothetical protein AB7K09_26180 [Planctomycetota bacterium]